MVKNAIVVSACCSAAALLPCASASAQPASDRSGTLVVNTVFGSTGESPVLEATGVFDGCTTVTQLDMENKFVRGTAVFSGFKRINCTGGTLVVAYHASFDRQLPGVRGSWRAVEGTGVYAGVTGGGQLTGDDNACDPMGTDGCVLDTYAGVLT